VATYGETISETREASGLKFGSTQFPQVLDFGAQLDRFVKTAREFVAVYGELKTLGGFATGPIKAEYDSIMGTGAQIYARVADLSRTFDWGINNLLGGKPSNLSGLGLAPLVLIPVAVVTGLIALITAWMSSANRMRQRLNFIREQQERGASAAEIDTLLNSGAVESDSGGWLSGIGGILALGIFGFVLLRVLK